MEVSFHPHQFPGTRFIQGVSPEISCLCGPLASLKCICGVFAGPITWLRAAVRTCTILRAPGRAWSRISARAQLCVVLKAIEPRLYQF